MTNSKKQNERDEISYENSSEIVNKCKNNEINLTKNFKDSKSDQKRNKNEVNSFKINN